MCVCQYGLFKVKFHGTNLFENYDALHAYIDSYIYRYVNEINPKILVSKKIA